jgi:hypothetical protein
MDTYCDTGNSSDGAFSPIRRARINTRANKLPSPNSRLVGQRRAEDGGSGPAAHDLAGHVLAAELTSQVMTALRARPSEASPPCHLRHAVPEPRRQPGPALGLPGGNRERQNEVVVGPLPPVEGVFRPVMTHFEAEVDEFPGQKGRSPDAGDA